jgi:hypothetical protein
MNTTIVARLGLVGFALVAGCSPRAAPLDTGSADALSGDNAGGFASQDARSIADAGAEDAGSIVDAGSDAREPDDVALVADASAHDAADADAGPSAPFVAPDFTLPDLNPNSTTHRMDVSPRAMRGRVTAWYFGTAT